MSPTLEKLFNTPIKITTQSKIIISCYPNFVTTYLQIFKQRWSATGLLILTYLYTGE